MASSSRLPRGPISGEVVHQSPVTERRRMPASIGRHPPGVTLAEEIARRQPVKASLDGVGPDHMATYAVAYRTT